MNKKLQLIFIFLTSGNAAIINAAEESETEEEFIIQMGSRPGMTSEEMLKEHIPFYEDSIKEAQDLGDFEELRSLKRQFRYIKRALNDIEKRRCSANQNTHSASSETLMRGHLEETNAETKQHQQPEMTTWYAGANDDDQLPAK